MSDCHDKTDIHPVSKFIDAMMHRSQLFANEKQNMVEAVRRVERLLAEAQATRDSVIDAAEELLKVAELRGDNELPHPANDPKLWTARMQQAWIDLEEALKNAAPQVDPGPGAGSSVRGDTGGNPVPAAAASTDSAIIERTSQIAAHRACCGTEHDPANGKLHGCCVVCGIPWPCKYAGVPPGNGTITSESAKIPNYKYPKTFCSQCGGEFGPGNNGFSHCESHRHIPRIG